MAKCHILHVAQIKHDRIFPVVNVNQNQEHDFFCYYTLNIWVRVVMLSQLYTKLFYCGHVKLFLYYFSKKNQK